MQECTALRGEVGCANALAGESGGRRGGEKTRSTIGAWIRARRNGKGVELKDGVFQGNGRLWTPAGRAHRGGRRLPAGRALWNGRGRRAARTLPPALRRGPGRFAPRRAGASCAGVLAGRGGGSRGPGTLPEAGGRGQAPRPPRGRRPAPAPAARPRGSGRASRRGRVCDRLPTAAPKPANTGFRFRSGKVRTRDLPGLPLPDPEPGLTGY